MHSDIGAGPRHRCRFAKYICESTDHSTLACAYDSFTYLATNRKSHEQVKRYTTTESQSESGTAFVGPDFDLQINSESAATPQGWNSFLQVSDLKLQTPLTCQANHP